MAEYTGLNVVVVRRGGDMGIESVEASISRLAVASVALWFMVPRMRLRMNLRRDREC